MAKHKKTQHGAWLHGLLQMPPPDFYHRPVLHIDCGGHVEVEGCRAVLLYNQEQIRLDMGHWQVSIFGDELELEAMNKRELQIRGRVLRTEFSYL